MKQSDAQILISAPDGNIGKPGKTGANGALGHDGDDGSCHYTSGWRKKLVCDCGTDGIDGTPASRGGNGGNGANGSAAPVFNLFYHNLTGSLLIWSQGGDRKSVV